MKHQLIKKVTNVIKFGEEVEGYAIPVLNEREIRAAAGILFFVLFMALMLILFERDYLLVKYVIMVFLTEFVIRIYVSPRYAPVLIIGRLIVSRQAPEFVSALPKKFAWKLGLTLSGVMFLLLDILNFYSVFTFIICVSCLLFLFFESAFGICLGCLFYNFFYKEPTLYCAGAACTISEKQAIQKTSRIQLLIVFGSLVFILLAITFFDDYFRVAPRHLKEIINFL